MSLGATIAKSVLSWGLGRHVLVTVVNSQIRKAGFGKVGSVTELKIDPAAKTIYVEVALEGEAAPLVVRVSDYALEILPDGTGRLAVGDVTTSKPWLEAIAKNTVCRKPVEIPAEFAKWLKLVL